MGSPSGPVVKNLPAIARESGGMHVWSVVASSVTIWTVAHQVPLSMEFSRQKYWSGLSFSTPGDFSDPGIEPMSLASPSAGRFFTTVPPGKPAFLVDNLILKQEIIRNKKVKRNVLY